MARGINKVILIGNLGNDPEVRYMPNGNAVTNVSVATTDSWKDRQTGQQQERTEWHRVVFFGRLAEVAGEYLRKGSKVYIEGALRTRKWQDQSGQDRYTTEIVVDVGGQMQMLDGRNSPADGGGAYPPPYGESAPSNFGQPSPQQAAPRSAPAPQANNRPEQPQQANSSQPAPSFDDFDDDIPF